MKPQNLPDEAIRFIAINAKHAYQIAENRLGMRLTKAQKRSLRCALYFNPDDHTLTFELSERESKHSPEMVMSSEEVHYKANNQFIVGYFTEDDTKESESVLFDKIKYFISH